MEEEIIFKIELNRPQAEKDLKAITGQLIALKDQNKQLETAIKNLQKAEGDHTETIKGATKEIEKNKQKISENAAQQKALIAVISAESNSINALRAQVRVLTTERNSLNLETAEGRARLLELNAAIDEHNSKIKSNVDKQAQQKIGIGAYKEAVTGAINQTKIFGVSIGDLGKGIGGATIALGAAGAALGGLFAAYAKSAAGARDLESAQIQVNTAFTLFSNKLADLLGADGKGGGILSFLSNAVISYIDPATGVIAQVAANAKQGLKEIEILQLTNNRYAKEQLDLAEEQRRIRDDESKSFDERMAGAKAVEEYINRREEALVETQQKRLANLQVLLTTDKNNLDIQKEIKQVEFEIADIQEDSEGKRTEALNGIIALEKEQLKIAEDREKLLEKQRQRTARTSIDRSDPEQEKADKIIEAYNAVSDAKNEKDKERQDVVDEVTERASKTLDKFQKKQDDAAKATKKREDLVTSYKKDAAEKQEGILLGLGNIIGIFAGKNKALALAAIAIEKGVAIARIVADTAIANAKAVALFPVTFGQPYVGINTASAAVSITGLVAAAAQQIGAIQGFAIGGRVLSGKRIGAGDGSSIYRSNGDNLLATVKTGEVILNERQQAALGGSRTFARIGVPGFAEGGRVDTLNEIARKSESASFQMDVLNRISQVQTVLVLQDFERKQLEINRVKTQAVILK